MEQDYFEIRKKLGITEELDLCPEQGDADIYVSKNAGDQDSRYKN